MESFSQAFKRFLKVLQGEQNARPAETQFLNLKSLRIIFTRVSQKNINEDDFASWTAFIKYMGDLGSTPVEPLLKEFDYTYIEHIKTPLSEGAMLQSDILAYILLKCLSKRLQFCSKRMNKVDNRIFQEALQHTPYGEYAILKWHLYQTTKKNEDLLKTIKEHENKLQACAKAQASQEKRFKELSDVNAELEQEKMDLEILCDTKMTELAKVNKKLFKVTKDYEQLKGENAELNTRHWDSKHLSSPLFEGAPSITTPDTPALSEDKSLHFSQSSADTSRLEEEIRHLRQECNLLSHWIYENVSDKL
ncbi:AER204W-Ap [Eremothecium gossypii ATCC 10895]|uniref:AER204W-Ap n=1 Tax=Eremothecium gossypii (strain ATCC 10895 / CBS 109.51 / FGSC 9923 / NRRL Y-1056) TaxID=284811 RepID=D8FGD6_EREGS|nr:AER204W-Ap [Eremothecium gossypii ATCC 10895]ADJ41779.1 AER204W-Ap [Eremothecium gossypii ATCC 10895]AEY97193.1 FAER204W-Ap [Eremothecium gossypii FDAG1]